MYKESFPIVYDAPADLKKWPSRNSERLSGTTPYLVYNGTLADCIRQLLAKPIKQICAVRHRHRTAADLRYSRCYRRPTPLKSRNAQGFSKRLKRVHSRIEPK